MSKTEEFKKLETWLVEREKQNHELLAENTVLKEKLADFTKRVGMGVTRWSEVMDLNRKALEVIQNLHDAFLQGSDSEHGHALEEAVSFVRENGAVMNRGLK